MKRPVPAFGNLETNMAYLLFEQILSLFLMMICGFVIVKVRLLKSEDSRILTVLSLYLILPCVIIRSFQIELTETVRNGFFLALGAAVLIHVLLLVLVRLIKKPFHLNEVEQGSLIYSNAGNLIIPLVTAVLGEEWVIYASAFMCVQLVFTWTHGQALISGEKGFNLKRIITNANFISIMIGIILMILKNRIPAVLSNAMGSIGATLGPIGMIMIGMLVGGMDLKAVFRNKRLYILTLLKMLVIPALVLFALKVSRLAALSPDGETILLISFLAVMTPSATIVTQISQLFGKDSQLAGAINVMTTMVCVATMPLMTQLYMML